jgi:hypothetical protein
MVNLFRATKYPQNGQNRKGQEGGEETLKVYILIAGLLHGVALRFFGKTFIRQLFLVALFLLLFVCHSIVAMINQKGFLGDGKTSRAILALVQPAGQAGRGQGLLPVVSKV